MAGPGAVTRDDLEQRFAAVQRGLQGKIEDRKASLLTIASVGATVVVLVVYLLGRRAGKRKSTLVEIRRL
jgi:hypothetical protein